MPDFLHVVPVSDDSVFDRVFEGEDTSLALSFVPNVRIFLSHPPHPTLVTRTSHDRGEHSSRGIISGETRFAHT